MFFPNIIRTYTVCSIDYVDLWNRSVLVILWPTTTKTHLVYQVVKRWIAPQNAHWNYSVFSVFKKISKVLHAYNWLKLQSLLNFAKVAFFDHHTSTYLLFFPHFEEEKRKNKDIDDCFYEYASASGNKRWSFDEIFYGLITIFLILFLGKIKWENCWCVFKEKFHN